MGPLTKVIAGGIGLASEYNADRKARKSASPQPPALEQRQQREDPAHDSDASTDYDEDSWELDEVEEGKLHNALEGEDGRDVDDVLNAFFQKHPQASQHKQLQWLSCPVILPQRRPQTNTRGFVRAYAPTLQGSDIDQATWMDFLNGFHKAIKMSPYFHATNVAIGIGALSLQAVAGPSITVHAAALAIHISVEASRRGYTRYQTNKYLDTMNTQLFQPRGLYALIMTYKPNSNAADEVVDLNKQITSAVGKRYEGHGSKFGASSGKTKGDFQLPAAAPLVFPELDNMSGDQKQSAFKKHGGFLGDYFDRRAQASFEAENPESRLNVAPRKEFASRFSDPNHPANSGSLMALATGGKVPGRRERRTARPRRQRPLDGVRNQVGMSRSGKKTGVMGTLKKAMKEDVYYLMVVNLPSEEEMKAVSATLDKAE